MAPGVVIYEYELKIGWGKSVALPSQALPAPPPGHMAIRSKEVCSISSVRLCRDIFCRLEPSLFLTIGRLKVDILILEMGLARIISFILR